MKKVLFVAFMVMAFMALGSMAAYACEDHAKAKTADASKVDAKQASATTAKAAGCCASKTSTTSASTMTTNATMASSKTTTANGAACTVADKAACAAKGASLTTAMVCSPENMAACIKYCEAKHAEICGVEAANHHLTSISIKGMTCASCETSVKTALMAVEGVNNVLEVCHKAGFAVVCTGKDSKLSNDSMIKAVSARGFESQIIPAVSVTTTTTNTTERAECSGHKKDGSK